MYTCSIGEPVSKPSTWQVSQWPYHSKISSSNISRNSNINSNNTSNNTSTILVGIFLERQPATKAPRRWQSLGVYLTYVALVLCMYVIICIYVYTYIYIYIYIERERYTIS